MSQFRRALIAWVAWMCMGAAQSSAQPAYFEQQVIQPAPVQAGDQYFGQTLDAGGDRLTVADEPSVFQYAWDAATQQWVSAASPLAIADTYSIAADGAHAALDDGASVRILGLPNEVTIPYATGIEDVALAETTLAVSFYPAAGLPVDIYEVPGDGSAPSFVESVAAPPGAVGAFGTAVALSGDGVYLAVGASGSAGQTGHVYVYKRSAGTYGLWWDHYDVEIDNAFGFSVALNEDGSLLVVGAPQEDQGNGGTPDDLGAVFVYDNLTQVKLAVYGGATPGGRLGQSVDVTGRAVLAGEPMFDHPTLTPPGFVDSAGRAVVFEDRGSGWTQTANLLSTAPEENQSLGITVAWGYGRQPLVGVPNRALDGPNPDRGAVYSFPARPFFADGFESGDVGAWSSQFP